MDSEVTIAVYDLTGRKVLTAFNGALNAGENAISLNRGGLSSGSYIYRVSVVNANGKFEESKQMIVR
jgi:hypothetical protein